MSLNNKFHCLPVSPIIHGVRRRLIHGLSGSVPSGLGVGLGVGVVVVCSVEVGGWGGVSLN